MNLVHIHLLLNHWPIIGSFVGLGLFLVSVFANSDALKQTSLAFLALIALLAIPTYMSGNVAQEELKGTAGVSTAVIETHQGAALIALVFMLITGLLALIGLLRLGRMSRPPQAPVARWNSVAVLLFALVTAGLMASTGNTGGAIRHPEILSGQEPASTVGAIGAKIVPATSHFVTESSRWVWPVLETLHFFGLILIVAAIGALNVRLLGFLKQFPVAPLHRLLPLGIAGVAINVVTGMLFFVGMPYFYDYNLTLYLKIGAIFLAGATLVLFYCTGAFHAWVHLGAGEDPPRLAKFIAASSLFLWIAIIVLGRYIPLTQDSLK